MTDLPKLILGVLASLFRSRAKLEAENLVLRPTQHLDNRDLDPVCTENLNPHVMVMAGEKKHGTLVAAVSTIENLVGGYGVKPGALWCRALRLGR
jgi:hypothetical protein